MAGRTTTASAAPIKFVEPGAPDAGANPALPGLLRALGSGRRLELLRVLAEGPADITLMADELDIPPVAVKRDLEALTRAGLVRKGEFAVEGYQLAQHAIRLLESALTYRSHDAAPPNAKARPVPTKPLPPLACTVCDNREFVAQMLGQLTAATIDARHYHRRIKEMSSQVLTAHEAERKRIARELHDDTAQALTSIVVRLRLLELTTKDEDVHRNIEELRELTSGALESVRRMAMDLRPAALDDLGLLPALQAYVERFSATWPIAATMRAEKLQRRLPQEIELVLYRVAQEALTNVVKHSSASAVCVSLSRRRNEVTLKIEDNGVGFNADAGSWNNGSGLGLFGMQERLALVGGEVSVRSTQGVGTTITARVPLGARRAEIRRAT